MVGLKGLQRDERKEEGYRGCRCSSPPSLPRSITTFVAKIGRWGREIRLEEDLILSFSILPLSLRNGKAIDGEEEIRLGDGGEIGDVILMERSGERDREREGGDGG